MDTIFTRRSVRQYEDKQIEAEKIDKLLRAAMQAPSAANQQPWEFLVVQNKENLQKLSKVNPYASAVGVSGATIIVMGNEDVMRAPHMWEQDLGAATQNILLQAAAMDLGTVWIGVAPNPQSMKFISDMFELPSNIKPYSVIAVGYPLEGRGNKFTDRYIEERVHHEKF